MFELLAISVPIFYIVGLVTFIRWIIKSRKKPSENKNRKEILSILIEELLVDSEKHPERKLSEQLKSYQNELVRLRSGEEPYEEPVSEEQSEKSKDKFWLIDENKVKAEKKSVLQSDLNQIWSNWYADNSINLLLYIGAFLIVASVSIFVGFQWETISGTLKALMVTLIATAFFGVGVVFYQNQKIKHAGATFIAIGALLIPFCGAAWQNFVLNDLGINFGITWFVTSFISLVVYLSLATILRNKFYTYIASLGALSLALSFVKIYDFKNEFYILGGILTSFLLMLGRILYRGKNEDEHEIFALPLEISANIIMPTSLVLGLLVASSTNKLFSLEASLSLFLAAAYYYLSYSFFHKKIYLIVTESLFPLSVISFFNYLSIKPLYLLYTLTFLGFADLVIAKAIQKYSLQEESDASLVMGMIKFVGIFLWAVFLGLEDIYLLSFSVTPIIAGLGISYIKKDIRLTLISGTFLAISTHILVNNILGYGDRIYISSLAYLGIGIGFFMTTIYFKQKQTFMYVFGILTLAYLTIGTLLSIEKTSFFLTATALNSALFYIASWQFDKKDLTYVANIFITISIINVARLLEIDNLYYPIITAATAYLFYALSRVEISNWDVKDQFRKTAILLSAATPIVFGIYSFSSTNTEEKYALISAYAATILLGLDSYLTKESPIGYFASAVGMITYLWQVKFLGITQTQAYTLPLGIYFLVLGYLRKLKEDLQTMDILNFVGIFFLVVPTLYQSFGEDGIMYFLLLCLVSICLIMLGISLKYKMFKYAGVISIFLAVISQTYDYIYMLPRWLVVGILGLGFLVFAIILLLRRSEQSKDPNPKD